MSLSTEFPFWFILFCLLIAAGGSWILYRKNKFDVSQKWILWLLYAFRFLSIFIITFLLLGPLMKMFLRKVEKPFIILAFDNSESILSTKDSVFYRKEIPNIQKKINDELQGNYEVKTCLFGKDVMAGNDFNFKEKQTDISAVFNEIDIAYSNQNLGAIVLASDGIYNEGSNPIYKSKALKTPIFTIALGDTAHHKDLLIKNVKHNQLVYLGNMFPLQIDVKAFDCNNQNTTLSISHDGEQVFTKTIFINAQHFFTTIPLELEAKNLGIQHYEITLSKLEGEASYINNRTEIFINVISGKQKIVLLAQSPHPDISAYKQAIEANENYQVDIKFSNEIIKNINDYNLAILHQLPGWNGEGMNSIKQLQEKKIPLLFILGSQTGLNIINQIENVLSVNTNRQMSNDVLPFFNSSFSLFSVNEDEINAVKKFPPLQAPYGNYNLKGQSDILFKQQIGYAKTEFPLIAFSKNGDEKIGFICGEGFWKWRLYDAELSHRQATQNIINKIVQYLSVKDDKSFFRITNNKKRFYENEEPVFDAEVFNQSYELINSQEVTMKIKNEAGKIFNFTFSKTDKAYSLHTGLMPVGTYSYEASVNTGNKMETVKGAFTIMPLNVEFLQTVADHQLLNQLSSQNDGKLFYPNQVDELINAIKQNEKIKPVIYQQEEVKSWINLKWILFLIVGLMSVEWFIRKWNGGV